MKTAFRRVNQVHYYIVEIGVIITILWPIFFSWNEHSCLAVFGDEFGYWGNAAIIAGLPWNSLMEETLFYGLGYSLLLVPFMKVADYVTRYNCAIALNMIMVYGMYICAKYIARSLWKIQRKDALISLEAFVSVFTLNVVVNSLVAWDEILLTFLYWLIAALLVSMSIEVRWWKDILLGFLFSFSILVHQRTLPIVIMLALVYVVLLIKERRYKNLILFGVVFAILIIGYLVIHATQLTNIYSNSESSVQNNITTTYIIGRIQKVFTTLKSIGISFLGKLVALVVSTYFLFLVAILFCMRELKDSHWKNSHLLEVILCIVPFIMMILTSVQCEGQSREDLVVYTRYFEFTLGPIILIALHYLGENGKKYFYVAISGMGCILIFKPIVEYINNSVGGFNYICSPVLGAIKSWGMDRTGDPKMPYALLFKYSLLCCLIVIGFCKGNERLKQVFLILFLVVSLCLSKKTVDRVNGWRNYAFKDALEISKMIEKYDQVIFFEYESDMKYLNVYRELQFIMPSVELKNINKRNEDGDFVLLTNKTLSDGITLGQTQMHKINVYYIDK